MTQSNQELLNDLKSKVAAERDLLVEILKLLQEVNQRRFFLDMGYGSLMDFCVKELGYSESAAYRRISAMRVAQDVPGVLPKLESGELTLAVVAQAQTFFRAEEKETGARLEVDQKSQVLEDLKGASSREAEKILLEKTSEPMRPKNLRSERIRSITPRISEVKLTLTNETLAKLNQLKLLYSHKMPQANYSEIIDAIANLALERLDPLQKPATKSSSRPRGIAKTIGAVRINRSAAIAGALLRRNAKPASVRKAIPAHLRRMIWQRSMGQCAFVDPLTSRRCISRYQLEVDHIIPLLKGGTSEPANLQLLCRSHNNHKGFG